MIPLAANAFVELRRHPRAQLRMLARIRWRGPLGMRVETTHITDISKGGVRIPRTESCDLGSRVWITFPFDAGASAAQPETPAHVVRVEPKLRSGYDVALQLDLPPRNVSDPRKMERRTCSRVTFAIPIFVRAIGSPWPEESMTHDISRAGARFESAHIFSAGDKVLATIPWGEWEHVGEIPARVVRVEANPVLPGAAPRANPEAGISGMLSSVAIRWDSPPKV